MDISSKHIPFLINWYETNFIGVLRYNDRTMQKQTTAWKKNKEKIFDKIDEIRSKLNRHGKGRKLTSKGLINRVVDAIPKQYRGLFDYNVVVVEGKLQLILNSTKFVRRILSLPWAKR